MCVYTLTYNDEIIYVGSTVEFNKRVGTHRDCWAGKTYTKMILYDFWRTVPFDDVVFDIIDDEPRKTEGRIIEEAYRAKHNPKYNKYRAHRSETHQVYMRRWKENNRESVNVSNTKYYQKNKDRLLQNAKDTRKHQAWLKEFSNTII